MLAVLELTFLDSLARFLDLDGFELRAILSILLVSIVAGLVGAMVVGNRMAFFSDAMAHCAFAGVALGILVTFFIAIGRDREVLQAWLVPIIMVVFGSAVGIGIAFVRERTGLASDTVIGVFFAGAIGFGAMLLTALKTRRAIDPEEFLFGSPIYVKDIDLLYLAILLCLTVGLMVWRLNQLLLSSFSTSLARSRGMSLRLNNYLFICLLALIVNLSISSVGVLLINAMLIVPAATASNVSRNLFQMFWITLGVSVFGGLAGFFLSSHLEVPLGPGKPVKFGPSGTIIMVSVCLFFLSMSGKWFSRRSSAEVTEIETPSTNPR